MTKKNTPARPKVQPKARKRKSWWSRKTQAALRFAKRVPWISLTLCTSAFVGLVLVEGSVAHVIHRMASDPITAVIFVTSAVLASLGVIFGPLAIKTMKSHTQRKWAEKIVAACFVLSAWNLSTTLANADAQMTADAVRAAPTFRADAQRLAALDRRIDAMSDEAGLDAALAVNTAERDTLRARLDGANPKPILFAWENDGWIFWAKAVLFHALIFGFSTGFAFQIAPARRPAKRSSKKSRSITNEDNVVAVQF